MSRLHSYVVRYDSGFAPNPFYDFCTLATCKPDIRRSALVGDWVLGTGSNHRSIRRGGHLVYAMCVSEIIAFETYDTDPRFSKKKPYRHGSRKQSCGDNIYYRGADGTWLQRDSFHSLANGTSNSDHIERDTAVNRVLVSDKYIYFGGYGPIVPKTLVDARGRGLCKIGIGRICFDDAGLLKAFTDWLSQLGVSGYQCAPHEWRQLRG